MTWQGQSGRRGKISVLLRLFVITDGLARIERIENLVLHGIDVSSHLWDLRRVHRSLSSGVVTKPSA